MRDVRTERWCGDTTGGRGDLQIPDLLLSASLLRTHDSRQMEAPHALAHCDRQLLSHDGLARVLGQLQIVDAGHHAGKVVVCGQWRLVRLTDDGQRRVEALETCDE